MIKSRIAVFATAVSVASISVVSAPAIAETAYGNSAVQYFGSLREVVSSTYSQAEKTITVLDASMGSRSAGTRDQSRVVDAAADSPAGEQSGIAMLIIGLVIAGFTILRRMDHT